MASENPTILNPVAGGAHHLIDGSWIPRATYRLQFNSKFNFQSAAGIAEYLAELGVSDCYASPIFAAGPQSTHGYDVCSHENLNDALGGEQGFENLTAILRAVGIRVLLDVVPNHMGTDLSNTWWRDVLENGRESKYASFFDVDWENPDPSLKGRVLLPILGNHYSEALEQGQITLVCEIDKSMAARGGKDPGQSATQMPALSFSLVYFDRKFPLGPQTVRELMDEVSARMHHNGIRPTTPERLLRVGNELVSELNGRPGDPTTFDRLHAMIQRQHYRLAYWRLAPSVINYRRFFDVNELVSMRVELDEVFSAMHRQIPRMLNTGVVAGLRIDHPDGLWDPLAYLHRLHALTEGFPEHQSGMALPDGAGANLSPSAPPGRTAKRLYVVVEKILTYPEKLPSDWPVNGTTGYDFLNRLNGLFVDPRNAKAFQRLYARFSGVAEGLAEITYNSKKQVLEGSFGSEIAQLTGKLIKIAHATRYGVDFTYEQARSVLVELVACFPIYRTYLAERVKTPTTADAQAVETALSLAAKEINKDDQCLLRFIGNLLLLRFPPDLPEPGTQLARNFIGRFQQLTGPAMAKGLEDTTFYRYNRLLSLNEVGGDPGRFGTTVNEFHEHNLAIARDWPHTLLATATHDTKRGEDVRARLNVLSEMPQEWSDAVNEWASINKAKKVGIATGPAPSCNDEYLFYQTLVGACDSDIPLSEGFIERLKGCILKSIREAKRHTSWTDPAKAYEDATLRFVGEVCRDRNFLASFNPFFRRVSYFGVWNSLSQVLLKTTCPGVPDIYRGTELWDFNMVDPDNRRPVDFDLRQKMLAALKAADAHGGDLGRLVQSALLNSHDGLVKLYLTWRALRFRARREQLFTHGNYLPLALKGSKGNHVVAFARTLEGRVALVVAPRLVFGLLDGKPLMPTGASVWEDTRVVLPAHLGGQAFKDVLTGRVVDRQHGFKVGEILSDFPGALLESIA